jgi:hypothetical protein
LEGFSSLTCVTGLERFSTTLHHRSHFTADVLIALASAFGLADSLEGGFMIGQCGLSLIVGAAS